MNQKTLIKVQGMTCSHCVMTVEKSLKSVSGVVSAKVNLSAGTAEVDYDPGKTGTKALAQAVRDAGYEAEEEEPSPQQTGSVPATRKKRFTVTQFVAIGITLAAVVLVIQNTIGFNFIPQLPANAGYGLLFVIGLFTSLHCVAMCGGINLSQCIKKEDPDSRKPASRFSGLRPSLFYNSGRIVSYTVIGGVAGGIGSAFSFSPAARAVLMLMAGIFMFIMGLNLLNAFSFLKKFNIRMPRVFSRLTERADRYGPFAVGLLNGLMPCGPLQAMQIYALGTGSILTGALSMFFFSLGTAPLLFSVGAFSTLLSKRFTNGMFKAGGVLVMVMGFFMVSNGFSLAGKPVQLPGIQQAASSARMENSVQVVEMDLRPNSYDPIRVVKGVPVRWIIHVKPENLTGCNNAIVVPRYGIQKALQPGDNVIEFTPNETGIVGYSCWMGMIRSSITVVDNSNPPTSEAGTGTNEAGPNGFPAGVPDDGISKIPTASIGVARIRDGVQEVRITVNDKGYTPAVIVLQKNIPAKIRFVPEKLTRCNYAVVFPEFNGMLDLSRNQLETPLLTVTRDFTFQCWMSMIHGYAKVVDDIRKVDVEAVKKSVAAYTPQTLAGCCGPAK